MCGEQASNPDSPAHDYGSSPRVRGTGPVRHSRPHHRRIIPACAGNRIPAQHPCRDHADHPRVCGEQGRRGADVVRADGSSPRVRGTVIECVWDELHRRIIPACAGNRTPADPTARRCTDHPRVCGEQRPPVPLCVIVRGSSPRVRGTVGEHWWDAYAYRIIPACAGNRQLPVCRIGSSTDHPRVCGEQTAGTLAVPFGSGSSPRVRGTGGRYARPIDNCRIIPACAGNRMTETA